MTESAGDPMCEEIVDMHFHGQAKLQRLQKRDHNCWNHQTSHETSRDPNAQANVHPTNDTMQLMAEVTAHHFYSEVPICSPYRFQLKD